MLQRAASLCMFALLAISAAATFAAEVMPPKPSRYFNDYANVVPADVEQRLNSRLEALEKTNSTQVVVAVFPKMQSESSIEDYTVRVAQSWGVGQKKEDNGAVLFVFLEDRQMFLQVGYGLEGALPDAIAKDITENRIKPFFRNNDYAGGLSAGVDAIIQAVGGEYQGTGGTVAGGQRGRGPNGIFVFWFILFLLLMAASRRRNRGHLYRGSGRGPWGGPIIWGGGGGGGWGGGGGFGGGFSGGGGSFGGGGAGSRW